MDGGIEHHDLEDRRHDERHIFKTSVRFAEPRFLSPSNAHIMPKVSFVISMKVLSRYHSKAKLPVSNSDSVLGQHVSAGQRPSSTAH